MESEFGLQRAVQSLGLDGPTHQTQNVNVSQTGRSLPLERAQAHSHVVLETDQSVECEHFIGENEFVGTAEGSNNNSFPDSSTHARVENVARQQAAVSRMMVCFQRLQHHHSYVSWMIRHRFASSVFPLSSALATIFVFFILGCPTTNVLNEVSQEAILRVGISWLLFLTLIIIMIHVLVIPLSSAVAAVYMLVSGTNSPPPRQVQQTTRTMQVRPTHKFGRQRRGASRYGTESIGQIRTEAWGPTFRPSLPIITEEPLGLPPLYPKELRHSCSSRCSQKRKMESAFEDEPPAKRLKRSDVTEELFFVVTPSDSGRHALVDPQPLILVSNTDECSIDSNEVSGDHYFTLPADELVSACNVTSNVVTADDVISLTYSDCDDGDLDSELVGIDIDLFVHDIADSQHDISSLDGIPEDTVGSNSAGQVVWSDSLLSQEVPPFVSLLPRKRCRLNLSSTVSPVPKQDYVRICQEWIPGIGWRVVRPRRRFGLRPRCVRNNASLVGMPEDTVGFNSAGQVVWSDSLLSQEVPPFVSRQRRGASRYGTESIGQIRTEAWGPTFRPSLPIITEEPLGLPPLYPKELRHSCSSRCSQKRKMESAFEDEPPAKRLKRSDVTEELFFVVTPSDSGRHALVDPQPLILVSNTDECSIDSNEVSGDHYFTLPADELVSASNVTSNVVTADDVISLTYSDCDDGDLDSELVGIDIDLFVHDIADSQHDISSLDGIPEDTVGSNSAGQVVWSDSLLSQEVPPFVSLLPRKRCRLNLSSTVSPVPKQDYVRICQEWIPGIGWRVVRPRRRFGLRPRCVRNNASLVGMPEDTVGFNSAGQVVWSDSLLSQEVPPFVSLLPRKRCRLNLSSTVSPVPKQDYVRICQEWIPGIGWRVVRPRQRFGPRPRHVCNTAQALSSTLQCLSKACATISNDDSPVSAPEPVDFTVVPSAAHITSVPSSRLEVLTSVSGDDSEFPIDTPTSIDDDGARNCYFNAYDSGLPPEPSTPAYSSPAPVCSSIPRSLPTAETTTTPNSSQTPIPPSFTPTINNELGSVMVFLLDVSGNPLVPRVEVRRSHRIASLPPVDYRDMCNDNEGDDDEDYVDGN